MKILDFTKVEFKEIQFDKQTIILPSRLPKILLLENETELNKLSRVMEEHIAPIFENDWETAGLLTTIAEKMGYEAYMVTDNEYTSRKISIKPADIANSSFGDYLEIYFGVLNSADFYLSQEDEQLIVKAFDEYFTTENYQKHTKADTKEIIKTFYDFVKESLEYRKNNKDSFVVQVVE